MRKFSIDQETAYAVCIILNFNYFVSITLFFWYLGPWLRTKVGTANTLRVWEYYVSCAWLGQTIAFWVGRGEKGGVLCSLTLILIPGSHHNNTGVGAVLESLPYLGDNPPRVRSPHIR